MWLDCDVIQADGGTRTASITGAYVAMALALQRLVAAGILKTLPLLDSVAGVEPPKSAYPRIDDGSLVSVDKYRSLFPPKIDLVPPAPSTSASWPLTG